MACNWIYFPNTQRPPRKLLEVVDVFDGRMNTISSPDHTLDSNSVLSEISDGLIEAGFDVEAGRRKTERLKMPVLFKDRGQAEKTFQADAFHPGEGIVVEVEAGRATSNYQFLKDFFEACMMQDARYLFIAVRNVYEYGGMKSLDYEKVRTFFKTLYASDRLAVPLKGIMILGY